jgi:cytoskeletal protein RodZ
MQCPNCAATLADDARFCSACGAPQAGGQLASPQPTQQLTTPLAATSATQPVSSESKPTSKAGLVIGIVVGVLVLLFACSGVGAFFVYRALTPRPSASLSGAPVDAGASARSSTSSAGVSMPGDSATVDGQAATGTPQPTPAPKAVTPAAPAAPANTAPSPEPKVVSLTKAAAIDLVGNYLNDAKEGDSASARAVTTSRYRSRITADYYKLAADALEQFEIVDTEKGQGGYLVYVKERWDSGTWTNWYLVVAKNGALVIDDTGTE